MGQAPVPFTVYKEKMAIMGYGHNGQYGVPTFAPLWDQQPLRRHQHQSQPKSAISST